MGVQVPLQGCPYAGCSTVYHINPVTQTAYLMADGMDASENGMPYETAFNAFYGYDETPYTAIPDPAGNLYLMTYNQIAEISGLNSALYMPSGTSGLADFSTSADQSVTYTNVGNASDTIPSYDLTYETNFHVDGSFPAGSCMAGVSLAPSSAVPRFPAPTRNASFILFHPRNVSMSRMSSETQ